METGHLDVCKDGHDVKSLLKHEDGGVSVFCLDDIELRGSVPYRTASIRISKSIFDDQYDGSLFSVF